MIEIRNLNKTYDKKSRNANHVLHDISLTLPDTGFICIVGMSGCGKTSLLNAVGGLDTFDNGTITTGKTAVSKSGTREYEQERNSSFSYIFQNYYLLSDHSVAYNVYLGLHSLALSHQEKLARVKEALEAVNMARYSRRIVGELSGGQQQRVAIARALARRPRVIFADEPTGNLDEENTINICTILRRISKTSLVVMVTHERHIANFFADRIITLDEGRIIEDSESWERESLTTISGNTLYTEDYNSQEITSDSLNLRVLTAENALPVNLTIAVLKDKIIIKTDDSRTVSCSKSQETPVLIEGRRPVITLEAMDNVPEADNKPAPTEQNAPAKAGKGITFSMMLQEASRLVHCKGVHRRSTWFFLMLMSVLTMWIVGDYLTVASIDPRDFITTDSHTLNMYVERGPALDPYAKGGALAVLPDILKDTKINGADFDILPIINTQLSYTVDTFPQLSDISVKLNNFSYAPIDRLDESSLVYGRMPENSMEVVVDRWVLEKSLGQDGLFQNIITDVSQFIGTKLEFYKKKLAPTIVGICDCNDPTVYVTRATFASAANMGTELLTLSELQSLYPGKYDDISLNPGECIVFTNNAGSVYAYKIGSQFKTNSLFTFTIVGAMEEDTYASIVISDESLDTLLTYMGQKTVNLYFYTPDKEAFKDILKKTVDTQYIDQIIYKLSDYNSDARKVYTEAATLKADARIIVTVTIIVLSMIMLYLLKRSYVQQRIGMMAVYRLLGIPKRKLIGIFALESFMQSLRSVLPASAVTWMVVAVLNRITALEFSMILPWQAGLLIALAITVYYLIVSLLPVSRLLRLPPARLAAKYDL